MPRKFGDWLVGRVVEANTGTTAGQVEGEFAQARAQMEKAVDDAFAQVSDRLHRSFSDPLKVDSNLREKMAQSLLAIARRLRGVGSVPQPQRMAGVQMSDLEPNLKDHVVRAADLIAESAEQASGFNVKSVGEFLAAAKQQVMGQIDRILQSLKNDMVHKGLTDLGSRVSAIHQQLSAKPLTGADKENAVSALADLGRAGVMQRQTGLKRVDSDIKIYPNPDNMRGYVTFDPTSPEDIEAALSKIADPRQVMVSIKGGKPVRVDLTHPQSVARVMTYLHSNNQVAPPGSTPDADPVKMAAKKRNFTMSPDNSRPTLGGADEI
jgi:hypothetical protein